MPDDYGITPTNQPSIHVLWERHGATITCAMVATEQPAAPTISTALPPGVESNG